MSRDTQLAWAAVLAGCAIAAAQLSPWAAAGLCVLFGVGVYGRYRWQVRRIKRRLLANAHALGRTLGKHAAEAIVKARGAVAHRARGH